MVEFVSREEWKQFQEESYNYGQYLADYEDYRKEEFAELKEALQVQTGEELTLAQYNRHYPYKPEDGPEYPKGTDEYFDSKASAQEFAFLKNLEGCQTRVFFSPGQDDGDELWEQL